MIAAKDLKHTITEEKQNGEKTNVRNPCFCSESTTNLLYRVLLSLEGLHPTAAPHFLTMSPLDPIPSLRNHGVRAATSTVLSRSRSSNLHTCATSTLT